MKATMKGDQALPVKVVPKESLNRKETGARTPGTRFGDVLSGLAEAKRSPATTTTDRAAEPATRVTIGRSADMHHLRSRRDVDPIPNHGEAARSDGEVPDSVAPSAAVQAQDATEFPSQHLPRLIPEHVLPQLQTAIAPTPADGPTPPAIDALLVDAGVQPPPLVHRKVMVVTGEPQGDVEPAPQTSPSDAPAGRLMDRPVVAARAVMEAGVRLDVSPKQSLAFPAAPSSDLRRMPVLGAGLAIQTEQSGPAFGRVSSGALGENLSILRNEKHFQPVAPATAVAPAADARLQPPAPAVSGPRTRADRTIAQDSAQPADERRSILASRAEPQIIPASPPTSVLQQLAGAIAQAVESDGAAPLASAADPTLVVRQPVGHEPLRILKIALEPAELGQVTVRLRLTGQTLELRVTADRAETASLLDRDRHLLSRILEASGYSAGDITVQPATPTPQPGAPSGRAAEPQAGTSTAPEFQSNGSADGEKHPSRSQDGHGHSRQEAERDEQDTDPRRRGDLYV